MDADMVLEMATAGPALPDAGEIAAALADLKATLTTYRAEFVGVLTALRADNEAMRGELARMRAQLGLPSEPDLESLSEYDRSVVLTVGAIWRDQYRRPVRTATVAARMNWSPSKIIQDLKRLAREEGVIFEHPSSGGRCSGLWSPMTEKKAG